MNNAFLRFLAFIGFFHLPPGRQAILNILIPTIGIIFFQWTPGALLFCFGLELASYWLCNTVLILFFARDVPFNKRLLVAGSFMCYNFLSIAGYLLLVAIVTDSSAASMQIRLPQEQIFFILGIYWTQFALYLLIDRPAGKVTTTKIKEGVYARLGLIYLLMIGYCIFFILLTHSAAMNYILAFILIFTKSFVDYVIIDNEVQQNKKAAELLALENRKTEHESFLKEATEKKAALTASKDIEQKMMREKKKQGRNIFGINKKGNREE